MFLSNISSKWLKLQIYFLLLLTTTSSSYRRDHRFLGSYRGQPSPAYISLLNTYSNKTVNSTTTGNTTQNDSKYFGQLVDRLNSDGKTRTAGVVLNNGLSMPLIGFGTWQLEGNETIKKVTIKAALDTGYRLIDTAYIYNTENAIGEVLEKAFFSTEKPLTREDIFLTTKVWPTFFSRARVLKSIRNSLKNLRLPYVDLVLLHFPTGFREGTADWPTFPANGSTVPHSWRKDSFLESWAALEEAVRLNLTKSIGVSNFNRKQMKTLLKRATIKPVLNQVESHPYLRNEKLRRFLAANKVIMQAYAPLRRGDKGMLSDKKLNKIGTRYGKSAAQVALRWQLDRQSPLVPVVVKSSNTKRMAENLDLFDFSLDPEEVELVNGLKQQPRIYTLPGTENHPDYPFNEE